MEPSLNWSRFSPRTTLRSHCTADRIVGAAISIGIINASFLNTRTDALSCLAGTSSLIAKQWTGPQPLSMALLSALTHWTHEPTRFWWHFVLSSRFWQQCHYYEEESSSPPTFTALPFLKTPIAAYLELHHRSHPGLVDSRTKMKSFFFLHRLLTGVRNEGSTRISRNAWPKMSQVNRWFHYTL